MASNVALLLLLLMIPKVSVAYETCIKALNMHVAVLDVMHR